MDMFEYSLFLVCFSNDNMIRPYSIIQAHDRCICTPM